MTAAHWAVIVAIISGVGLQLAGLEHWVDATNPKFVAGLLVQISGSIGALFAKQIGRDPTSNDRSGDR